MLRFSITTMLLRTVSILLLSGFFISVKGGTTESPLDTLRGPIFLTEPPDSLPFANTKGAQVPCTAFGRPAPALDWIKGNGSPVEDVPGLLKILSNNTLYFYSFEPSAYKSDVHAQTYRCIASNTAGRVISRTMRVKAVLVKDYTAYNLQLNGVWATLASTAVFRCSINPYFVKDYIKVARWTRGSTTIEAGERVSILPDGELHIRDVRYDDDVNKYTCIARNILTGEERSSMAASLVVHPPPVVTTAPKMDDVLRSVTVNEGEDAELPCVGSGNPLPTYRWTKKGHPVVIDNIHVSQKGGNLIVMNANVEDSGQYMCNSSNTDGSVTAVTELVIKSTLQAVVDPAAQMIDSGQSATFNCSVSGHPITAITWYKNGQVIVANERIDIHDDTLLEISNINRIDQGMYQCIVNNDESSFQATAQLLLGDAHPTFIDTFVDQYVQSGQRTSLRCVAAGNPVPEVRWKLDGEDVKEDTDIKVGSSVNVLGDVVSFINISSVRITIGGEYKCIATNEVGEISHVGNLFVYGVPFVKPIKNITATANEALSVRCYVAGYPVQSITWSKDGYTLPHNHLQKVINGTLYIEKVQKTHDTGEYTCTARNANGQGMSRNLFVTVLEPPIIDQFRFQRKKQGDRAVVSCVVSSGDQPLVVYWTKDGEDIPPDMGIQIQNHGTYSLLSIGDASPKHNGNYTCHASNAAATVNYTATLFVDVPPRWIIEPEDSFVILGKSVAIDCLTAGTPDPKVTWKKAIGSIPGMYEAINYVDDDNATDAGKQLLSNGTLILRDAMEKDHGYYLCHSHNGVGLGLSKVIFLTVHIPARFDEQDKNYTVKKGQNITMDCQAIGDQPMSVTWSNNGQTLTTSKTKRYHVTTTVTARGKLSNFALLPAIREDSGNYTCKAINKFGNGTLSMRLTVIEAPEPPTNLTSVVVGSRNVTVQWQKPYDGNSPIMFYTVEYKKDMAVWQGTLANVSVSSENLTATISGLHPAYVYHLRVRANNSVGYGTPSQDLIVSMLEEAPSGPPTDVAVKAIGSESLKITWMPPIKDDQNGKVKGYYIGYKESSSLATYIYYTKQIVGAFMPELVLHNLKKFTEYSVHVQAYNDRGRGPRSQDLKVYTLEDVPSQPPQGVQATAINSRSVKVIWSPPPLFTLHGILQGYKILYKPVRFDEDERDANTVTSSQLETIITGLATYTNYSLQVLAFTRKGEGVRSEPLYIMTQQDIPEKPADIKALPVNSSSVLLSWRPPLHPNGVIARYNIYIQNMTENSQFEDTAEVTAPETTFLMVDLPLNMEYSFQVSASTIIGEGPRTHVARAAALGKVAARIASFSEVMLIPWQHTLTLQCLAVGDPPPKILWKIRGKEILPDHHISIHSNGSLHIDGITGQDAANYTCRAENTLGSDEITYTVSVQVSDNLATPPRPPSIYVVATTTSTIQVNWRSGSNGGSPIQGFTLHYKKDHEGWHDVNVGPANRSHTLTGLLCGTMYKLYINAYNRLGNSSSSATLSVKTNGSTPMMPPQSMLLKSINVTSVDLDFGTWLTSGCPIRFFSVRYQVRRDVKWTEVGSAISRNTTIFSVSDLHPATWYVMKVVAHSDAGSTESQLQFPTLDYHGSPIVPVYVARKVESHFYEDPYVMIPTCAGIVALSVLIVAVLLYCKRRRELIQLKESASNLRRDLTAETSLMNDLDKRFNFDCDGGHCEPFSKRNVNLLISLNSDENIHSNSQAWLNNGSSKTNSDNGSLSRSDDDGNINPYATFNQIKQVLAEKHEPNRNFQKTPEMDDISLEKMEAQKAMTTPSEPYVPFFHSKGDNSDVVKDPRPPLIPMKASRGYDNQGLVLSPRKYASADQIHALFTQGPQRPHSSYGKSKPTSHGSSDEKGSQRQSIISSVTTVSSSRDELLEALENAKRNPPPPVVYESQPDSSSQPTDSSIGTEAGIVQFTQSPPKPNEQREASCEVHYTGESKNSCKRPRREVESDTTECEMSEKPRESHHPRRNRGRHRGKQRGQIAAKRQILPAFAARAHSRTSTTSSEEVTYTFGGRDSPHSNSPSEGYLSYPPDSQGYPESDFSSHQRGRRTPHARVRYDTTLTTPGTDESRPLVMAQAQPMSSPAEEDEDSISLLDRYYRPVESQSAEVQGPSKKRSDKGYTEDFTIV